MRQTIDENAHDFNIINGVPYLNGLELRCRKMTYEAETSSCKHFGILTVELYVKPLQTAESGETQ